MNTLTFLWHGKLKLPQPLVQVEAAQLSPGIYDHLGVLHAFVISPYISFVLFTAIFNSWIKFNSHWDFHDTISATGRVCFSPGLTIITGKLYECCIIRRTDSSSLLNLEWRNLWSYILVIWCHFNRSKHNYYYYCRLANIVRTHWNNT